MLSRCRETADRELFRHEPEDAVRCPRYAMGDPPLYQAEPHFTGRAPSGHKRDRYRTFPALVVVPPRHFLPASKCWTMSYVAGLLLMPPPTSVVGTMMRPLAVSRCILGEGFPLQKTSRPEIKNSKRARSQRGTQWSFTLESSFFCRRFCCSSSSSVRPSTRSEVTFPQVHRLCPAACR